jgi:hypothetical protein
MLAGRTPPRVVFGVFGVFAVLVLVVLLLLLLVVVVAMMGLMGEGVEARVDGVSDLWRLRVRGRVDAAEAGRLEDDAGGWWAFDLGLLRGLSVGVERVDEGVAGELRPLRASWLWSGAGAGQPGLGWPVFGTSPSVRGL